MSEAASPQYLWYGDDFTGASDTLATFACSGLRARLCLGVPAPGRLAALPALDALGIAGAARTLSPEQMTAELEPVGRYAAASRVPLLHYKCCSTFDSSPAVGSLGAAMRILKPYLPGRFTPIIGGQPSLERYCAFGNLFAGAGPGSDIFRLDRHPTMSRHPSTPMHEADLRLHLRAQGVEHIRLVDWRALSAATDDELNALIGGGTQDGAILFDALDHSHLARIGELIWRRATSRPLLAIGASSVAQAIIAHWQEIGLAPAPGNEARVKPAAGPVFVLVGSQSPVSAQQTAAALSDSRLYEPVRLDPGSSVDFEAQAEICAGLLGTGRSVLAYLAPVVSGGPPRIDVARACAGLLQGVLARTPGLRRVGIAGGDTSSIAVEALDIWALDFAGLLGAGVSLTRAHADDPRRDGLELMLKGGQMGPIDVFARLLHGT